MTSPSEESQPRPISNNFGNAMTNPTTYMASSRRPPLPPSALPGQSLHAPRQLDSTQTMPASPSAYGDGFASWRGLGMLR